MTAGRLASLAVLLLLAGFACVGASFEVLTHDVSYYLYVSREVIGGALPYRDYIDPNLPTIIYLGVPIAAIADALDVGIHRVFQGFVVALELVSLAMCAGLLRPADPSLHVTLSFNRFDLEYQSSCGFDAIH